MAVTLDPGLGPAPTKEGIVIYIKNDNYNFFSHLRGIDKSLGRIAECLEKIMENGTEMFGRCPVQTSAGLMNFIKEATGYERFDEQTIKERDMENIADMTEAEEGEMRRRFDPMSAPEIVGADRYGDGGEEV